MARLTKKQKEARAKV
ncbi:MAG: hypothetical protein VW976_02185, partial [Flavobacteriaceae bacterium]